MPRVARIVIPGCPHHVTQRGNNRQDVFFADDDRRAYLRILSQQAHRFGLGVLAYCLMTNHVHLIVTPREASSLAKALGQAHFLYTQYINRLHGRVGHIWQNRFFSCALDEAHLWAAICYVERNPLRAGLVRRAWLYRWSSAPEHCGIVLAEGMLETNQWERMLRGRDWKEALAASQDDRAASAMRVHTQTGRPLGGDNFLSRLEATLGRRLRALPVGRPRKTAENRRNK